MRELAEYVLGLTGGHSPVHYVEAHPDDPQRRRPDIGRARRVLDWEPEVRLFDGLKETIAAFALAGDLSAV